MRCLDRTSCLVSAMFKWNDFETLILYQYLSCSNKFELRIFDLRTLEQEAAICATKVPRDPNSVRHRSLGIPAPWFVIAKVKGPAEEAGVETCQRGDPQKASKIQTVCSSLGGYISHNPITKDVITNNLDSQKHVPLDNLEQPKIGNLTSRKWCFCT